MRAFVINEFGGSGQIEEVSVPQPAEGEVVVRVHIASVNPMDAFVVSGGTKAFAETRLPLVPGIDAAGTIESIGLNTGDFAVGDAVVALASTKPFWGAGTFAELVAVPADAVAHKPAGMTDVVAATVPLTGLTAFGAIEVLELQPGEVVATIGATGGVGGWFTQLATLAGAHVVALVRGENAAYATELGAAEVIDYASEDPISLLQAKLPDGIDAIADFAGDTELIDRLTAVLRPGGRIASSGTRLDTAAYESRGFVAAQANRTDLKRLTELLELLAAGKLQAPEARVMPLASAGEALAEVGQRHTRGKVVLKVA